jgi:hypothetical protein
MSFKFRWSENMSLIDRSWDVSQLRVISDRIAKWLESCHTGGRTHNNLGRSDVLLNRSMEPYLIRLGPSELRRAGRH